MRGVRRVGPHIDCINVSALLQQEHRARGHAPARRNEKRGAPSLRGIGPGAPQGISIGSWVALASALEWVRAERRTLHLASMLAPPARSALMHACCPIWAAWCSGLLPSCNSEGW